MRCSTAAHCITLTQQQVVGWEFFTQAGGAAQGQREEKRQPLRRPQRKSFSAAQFFVIYYRSWKGFSAMVPVERIVIS